MCFIYISHFNPYAQDKYNTEHNAGLKLLSMALEDYFHIHLSEKELSSHIKTGPYGKPFLEFHDGIFKETSDISCPLGQHTPMPCSPQDIHFNISHSNGMAACAVSTSPVGIDIERIRPFNEHILKKALTLDEQNFLETMSIDDTARQEWFFRFWTLKESIIKHAGMGFSMPLTDFSFRFDLTTTPWKITCSKNQLCFMQELICDHYVLSVCTSRPQATFRNRHFIDIQKPINY